MKVMNRRGSLRKNIFTFLFAIAGGLSALFTSSAVSAQGMSPGVAKMWAQASASMNSGYTGATSSAYTRPADGPVMRPATPEDRARGAASPLTFGSIFSVSSWRRYFDFRADRTNAQNEIARAESAAGFQARAQAAQKGSRLLRIAEDVFLPGGAGESCLMAFGGLAPGAGVRSSGPLTKSIHPAGSVVVPRRGQPFVLPRDVTAPTGAIAEVFPPISGGGPVVPASGYTKPKQAWSPSEELGPHPKVITLPAIYTYIPSLGNQQLNHAKRAVTCVPDVSKITNSGFIDPSVPHNNPDYQGKWRIMTKPGQDKSGRDKFRDAQKIADSTNTSKDDWYLLKYTQYYPPGGDWSYLDYHFAYNAKTGLVVMHYFKADNGIRYGYPSP